MATRRPIWRYGLFQIPTILLVPCLVATGLSYLLGFGCPNFWTSLFLGLTWVAFMWALVMPLDYFLKFALKLRMSLAGRISLFNALFWTALTIVILAFALPTLREGCKTKIVTVKPDTTPWPSLSIPELSELNEQALSQCQQEAEASELLQETMAAMIPSTGQEVVLTVNTVAKVCGSAPSLAGKIQTGEFTAFEAYNIAFVIDTSRSTIDNSFAGQESVVDLNGDGRSGTILDSEIAGFLALHQSIIDANIAEDTTIGVIAFSDDTLTELRDTLTPATLDRDNDGVFDTEQVLKTLKGQGGTDFNAGLQAVISFFNQVESQDKTNLVFFLSDGLVDNLSDGEDLETQDKTALLIDRNGINAEIRAIGLGQESSLEILDRLDDNLINNSAIRVSSPSGLEAGLTRGNENPSEVSSVEFIVNGEPQKISAAQLSLTEFTHTLEELPVGQYTITTRIVFDDPEATSLEVSQTIEVIAPQQF